MAEPFWTVAVVQTNRESYVLELLKRQGFECYLPKIRIAPKRTASLFPGYLITRVIVRWYPIRWCPGVLRLLMSGERPARLADDIVDEIRGREVRGFVKLPRDPNAIEPGMRVRITRGTFAGHVAIYQGMSGPQRERVLLDLLGQSVPITMAVGQIEAVRVS